MGYCICVPLSFELGFFLGSMVIAVIAFVLTRLYGTQDDKKEKQNRPAH